MNPAKIRQGSQLRTRKKSGRVKLQRMSGAARRGGTPVDALQRDELRHHGAHHRRHNTHGEPERRPVRPPPQQHGAPGQRDGQLGVVVERQLLRGGDAGALAGRRTAVPYAMPTKPMNVRVAVAGSACPP